jgi:hypothetical protein
VLIPLLLLLLLLLQLLPATLLKLSSPASP